MKVSVIVPVYNVEKYLDCCMLSLVHQNLEDIEIIAINDASTDQSDSILKKYQKQYPTKITILENETNLGLSRTRNKGLSIARGEYVGFVDSDDFVSKEMYQDMYEGALAAGKPDIVTTGLNSVPHTGFHNFSSLERSRKAKLIRMQESPKQLEWENPSCCDKIFRRDFIQGQTFLEDHIWEDFAFTYSQMIRCKHLLQFNNPDYYYRENQNGIMMTGKKRPNSHLLDIFDVVDTLEKTSKQVGNWEIFGPTIRLLQAKAVLQRVLEVSCWDIMESEKRSLMNEMTSLMYHQYGKDQMLPNDLLKLTVLQKYLYLDQIKEERNIPKQHLQKKLQNLSQAR